MSDLRFLDYFFIKSTFYSCISFFTLAWVKLLSFSDSTCTSTSRNVLESLKQAGHYLLQVGWDVCALDEPNILEYKLRHCWVSRTVNIHEQLAKMVAVPLSLSRCVWPDIRDGCGWSSSAPPVPHSSSTSSGHHITSEGFCTSGNPDETLRLLVWNDLSCYSTCS